MGRLDRVPVLLHNIIRQVRYQLYVVAIIPPSSTYNMLNLYLLIPVQVPGLLLYQGIKPGMYTTRVLIGVGKLNTTSKRCTK